MKRTGIEEAGPGSASKPDEGTRGTPAGPSAGRYEPPRAESLGVVFEGIDVDGAQVFVKLAPAFFSLATEWREPILGLVLRAQARCHPAPRRLVLRDFRGNHVGRFSFDRGLELS